MKPNQITDNLIAALKQLSFSDPVSFVYNPLEYARKSNDTYFNKYGQTPRKVLMLGMNPGPFGMAQTGVPFGEVEAVKSWLKIDEAVDQPAKTHPKRPIQGFACQRSEVSGRRIWNWAQDRFESPERFFETFFVINYCPLIFLEESGRNRTPDKLPKQEREPLFQICDNALIETVRYFQAEHIIGIGAFAEKRAIAALKDFPGDIKIHRITHPSPANPKANRGWQECIEKELADCQIDF